jgi:hypothetical protein
VNREEGGGAEKLFQLAAGAYIGAKGTPIGYYVL